MKQTIRLTESDLQNLVRESVSKVLTELNWQTAAKAAKKRMEQGKEDNAEKLAQYATDRFNDEFGYEELDGTNDENNLPYRQDVQGTVTPYGTAYAAMGRWTPQQSQMHAGYYPSISTNGSHEFNTRSRMKPTKNIIDKYQKATDEIAKFNNGETNWQNESFIRRIKKNVTEAIKKVSQK
jgi:hypothetical protein